MPKSTPPSATASGCALFFDIDGTLISLTTHRMPTSALRALRRARQLGCRLFIASGRPLPWIATPALSPLLPLVDGIIALNGALAVVEGLPDYSLPMDPSQVQLLLDDARRCGYPCIVVGRNRIAILGEQPFVRTLFEPLLQLGHVDMPAFSDQMLHDEPILQVSPFFTLEQERAVMPLLSRLVCCRWHPAFADVTAHGATKGEALRSLVRQLSLDPRRTVAFGDGANDISMFRAAAVGVAMGGAAAEVQQQARIVAPPLEEDGLAHVLDQLLFSGDFPELLAQE